MDCGPKYVKADITKSYDFIEKASENLNMHSFRCLSSEEYMPACIFTFPFFLNNLILLNLLYKIIIYMT